MPGTLDGDLKTRRHVGEGSTSVTYPPPSRQHWQATSQLDSTSKHGSPKPRPHKSKNSIATVIEETVVLERMVSRTPSPTPSEVAILNRKGLIDWNTMKSWKFWLRKDRILRYVIIAIVVVFAVLIGHYNREIVQALSPTAIKLRDMPAGWLIPIGLLVVLSFPPLFGHEIINLLCGVIWGFGIGFGIVCAGTLLGEIANFYAFRCCCQARGNKFERTNLHYGCLARIVREGGFKIALIARFSAIPGHLLTAVFSTCGMNILVFTLAASLSLPKQAALVYIGTILEKEGSGEESPKERGVSLGIVAVTLIITAIAMRYVYRKMDEVKADVVYARRKNRQLKRENSPSTSPMTEEIVCSVGVAHDVQLHAPTPFHASPASAVHRHPPIPYIGSTDYTLSEPSVKSFTEVSLP